MPMITMVMRKVYFRPIRSPRRPNTIAPNGRTANPAAKVSSAMMNAGPGARDEKKCTAMTAASEPYR